MSQERYQQRLASFGQALKRLTEALALPQDDVVRDAVIQRFEFTFELAWKAMRLWLQDKGMGLEARTPKDVLTEALQAGLIVDGNAWSRMQEHRNTTSHTYDRALAESVEAFVRSTGQGLFRDLEAKLRSEEKA
jgi:nucleotidyltransferase substrate binding protein (TIGR01987 family)